MVEGISDILILAKNSSHQFISQVYYIHVLQSNILTLGQLLEKGYDIRLKDGGLTIRDSEDKLLAKVKMSKNRLFSLLLQADSTKCFKTSATSSSCRATTA